MDDADRGARGLRARPGPALLHALQEHWGLGRSAGAVDLGGSSSLNLLVDGSDGQYVARVHRPHVSLERLAAIHRARAALLAGGVPCAPPLLTLRGAPWISLQGRLVEVEAYVGHDAKLDTWERLATGMLLLARAHNLLAPRGRRGGTPAAVRQPPGAGRGLLGRPPGNRADPDLGADPRRAAPGRRGRRRSLPGGAAWSTVLTPVSTCRCRTPSGPRCRWPWPRQALSSVGGWVARLDDEPAARRHAASAGPELVAARRMLAELDRWRDAFAR